ncbi:hypothetical protein CRG98_007478 [Punica granatum]|uniref:Uncharacterized protein n=1 Tax=Punica granatum TaxID=22663 RepID=A0A2I0KUF4_PUNGR|nr:hypothetical protein CRG98_007478 [Punica granatum]
MDDECIRLATESGRRIDRVSSRTSKSRKETSGPCSGRHLDGNTSDDSTRCRSRSPIQHRGLPTAGDCTLSMLPPARYTSALEENLSNGNIVGFGMLPPPKECTLNAPNNQGANSNSANPNTQEASQCPGHDHHNQLRDELTDDNDKSHRTLATNLSYHLANGQRGGGNFHSAYARN